METDLIFCNIKQETKHSALTVIVDCTVHMILYTATIAFVIGDL